MNKAENLINQISQGKNLSFDESKLIFLNIMTGQMNEDLIYKFLTSLSSKGETAEEIAGGVYVLREKALKVNTYEDIVDTCGTGGDGMGTVLIDGVPYEGAGITSKAFAEYIPSPTATTSPSNNLP